MERMIIQVVLLALIGAAIGYTTNVIAIKLLFKPYKPLRIPILNLNFQGLLPKRKAEIAERIGDIIEKELVCISELLDIFITDERIEELIRNIKEKTTQVIRQKTGKNPLLSGFGSMINDYVDEIIEAEGREYIHEMIHKIGEEAENEICIKDIVREKINSFDLRELEKIVYQISSTELKHIEIMGGALGFVIGIIQGIIVQII